MCSRASPNRSVSSGSSRDRAEDDRGGLTPLVAIVTGAVLLGELVQLSFLLGGAVVLVGVYVGAIYRPKAGAGEREPDAASAEA